MNAEASPGPLDIFEHHLAAMGTTVSITVVGEGETDAAARDRERRVGRAINWFREVERRCSRFDPSSELRQLTARAGEPVQVSDLLFEAVRFAMAVAEDTEGAFDPTVGARMESRGFDRHYQTGERSGAGLVATEGVTFRDVRLDSTNQTIALTKPLVLDLGAVAKGMAIDMARLELAPYKNFAIDAGGDLFLAGHNPEGEPWSAGIRHPRDPKQLAVTVRISDLAMCTSGDYERRTSSGHHLVDPRSEDSASTLASATVLAPAAMVADAFATAAFVLGPTAGLEFLKRHGVEGCLITPDLTMHRTKDFT